MSKAVRSHSIYYFYSFEYRLSWSIKLFSMLKHLSPKPGDLNTIHMCEG